MQHIPEKTHLLVDLFALLANLSMKVILVWIFGMK